MDVLIEQKNRSAERSAHMIRRVNFEIRPEENAGCEGDLYKVLCVEGEAFPLYYGYYDECERNNVMVEPMPIYPDFLREPRYTAAGFPFVTKMQDACGYYDGHHDGCAECAECIWYRHGEELLGTCGCLKNKQNVPTQESGE